MFYCTSYDFCFVVLSVFCAKKIKKMNTNFTKYRELTRIFYQQTKEISTLNSQTKLWYTKDHRSGTKINPKIIWIERNLYKKGVHAQIRKDPSKKYIFNWGRKPPTNINHGLTSYSAVENVVFFLSVFFVKKIKKWTRILRDVTWTTTDFLPNWEN